MKAPEDWGEISLKEWIEKLPKSHRARKEFDELVRAAEMTVHTLSKTAMLPSLYEAMDLLKHALAAVRGEGKS